MSSIKAIETHYAGYRFRSRLEARWAVFFDHLGIRWEYEPQGFVVGDQPYLPDFLLVDLGTWVEVKGSEDALDHRLMERAAIGLPRPDRPLDLSTPALLVLGPIPREPSGLFDLGWIGMSGFDDPDHGECVIDGFWGFGPRCLRPVYTSCATAVQADGPWLEPVLSATPGPTAIDAYEAARWARFEHGERP